MIEVERTQLLTQQHISNFVINIYDYGLIRKDICD
jgi:hypothetical protein